MLNQSATCSAWMDADPPTPGVDGTLVRETAPYLYPVTGSPIKLWKLPDVRFVANHASCHSLLASVLDTSRLSRRPSNMCTILCCAN